VNYNYSPAVFSEEDIAEYVRVYSTPGALRATFRWYAEGLRTDAVNLAAATEKLTVPVLVYGGSHFFGDPRPFWEPVAENLDGGEVPACGHFIPEEKPEFVIEAATKFFEPLAH
jgi:pimeloyl-ACP methyl ester carboxylesterase